MATADQAAPTSSEQIDLSVPFLDLKTQHRALEAELVEVFRSALREAAFIGGREVSAFESEFSAFCGVPHCVGVSSGTDALRLACIALGIQHGGEVITAANTFIATTEAITQAGGRVRLVDVDEATLTLDVTQVEHAISPRTVGLVPVHLYGQPADMAPIVALARRHGLWVLEDACQAHGARYNGQPAGALGELAAFSFYPGKNLGALGDGGAVVGHSPHHMQLIRQLREHGQSQKYVHESEGYTARLDAIQAAFLRIKLRHLNDWVRGRRRAAGWYREALAEVAEVRLPQEAPYAYHVYHLFVVRVPRRDELQQYLQQRGIGTGLHYPVPLHLQRAYAGLGHGPGSFPVAEAAAETMLSLPMFPELTKDQVSRVADHVRSFYGQ
jgi:dTDP-4-amino-4,6-dideoxygalactose transaminase